VDLKTNSYYFLTLH